MLYFGVIATLVSLRHRIQNGSLPTKRLAAVGLLLLAFVPIKSGVVAANLPVQGENHPQYEIIRYLEEEELTYGYATFWNASHLTARANGSVTIHPFEWKNGEPAPSTYQANRHWYENQPGVEQYFLMLWMDEYDVDHLTIPEDYDTILECDPYMVFVYDYNPLAP